MPKKQQHMKTHGRLVWARFNAYGVLLAGIAVFALTDLIHPAGSDLARLVGQTPPGQTVWVTGFGFAGALMLLGFFRADRIAETAGLTTLTLAVAAQTGVAFALLGWNSYSATRLAILGLVILCSTARVSSLWSKEGVTVTIPPRGEKPGDRR